MEIILKKDVENLGFADDVVTVKDGYGRNFLIPQGYGVLATESAKKVLAENLRQRAHKEAQAIADAKAVRETALENAKIALEEAFTPRLQSMLSKKIQKRFDAASLLGLICAECCL